MAELAGALLLEPFASSSASALSRRGSSAPADSYRWRCSARHAGHPVRSPTNTWHAREAMAHNPRRPGALMSGTDAHPDMVLEALALGPVVFVSKPLDPGSLDSSLKMFPALLPGALARR